MILSVGACAFACLGLIFLVLFKPTVTIKNKSYSVYHLPALAGGIFLLVTGTLTFKEAWSGLTASGDMNPLKILSLFISLTFLSVYLDELGFFRKIASVMLKKTKGSQKKLFLALYALVSVLTVFTSNDIVVLTFTPFICFFCKEEQVSPVPYLVGEFVAANTWSMALMIGNPTNIYLSSVCGIGFFEYFKVMWLPTLLAGLSALGILLLVFKKQLQKEVSPQPEETEIWDKGLLVIGAAHLGVCVIALAVSSYLTFPMWLLAVGFAVSLIVCTVVYSAAKRKLSRGNFILTASVKRAPWTLVPFVLSMFLIVSALQKYGVTTKIGDLLNGEGSLVKYGVASFLVSNVINNIPMSVLFGGVLLGGADKAAVFASVIGSNLGAYLTPVGALAGIMWTGLLKRYEVKFSFRDFLFYGAILSVPALGCSLFGLWLVV